MPAPEPIYLDHNATTPVAPEVIAAMVECQARVCGNPASQHAAGRQARAILEEARDTIGRLLGANVDAHRADRVIFTSGATEANNLAIFGLAAKSPGAVYVSTIEHPSVLGPAEALRRRGAPVETLRVTTDGVLDLVDATERITPEVRLVSVMLGNNDTGVLQPIEQLGSLCAERTVPLHTDAAQAVGKIEVDFRQLGVAAMSASAHKFHGPVGVGVLIVRADVPLNPLLFGGFQQEGLRPGTESVALAVGMRRALQLWHEEREARAVRVTRLRERLEAGLRRVWPNIVIQGRRVPRLPHTVCASFVGLDRQALVVALDLAGVACSTGSACASGSTEASPALVAAAAPPEQLESALRFSLGAETTALEIDAAVDRIAAVCGQIQRAAGGRKMAGTARSSTLPPV